MIFLTVGTQLPFDRLVRAVDAWAAERSGVTIFGQIADPGPQGYIPRTFEWRAHLEPAEFERRFAEATVIVAHAGMGTIIGALTASKPVLILPRRAALGEQRNDHQVATAQRFADRPGVSVCMEEAEISAALDRLALEDGGSAAQPIGSEASPELIAALRGFVRSAAGSRDRPPGRIAIATWLRRQASRITLGRQPRH